MQFFTDIPMPVKAMTLGDVEIEDKVIDEDRAYAVTKMLNLVEEAKHANKGIVKLVNELRDCIDKRIEFENRKLIAYLAQPNALNEIAENVNALLNKGVDLIDTVISGSEELLAGLTQDKVNKWFGDLR